MFICGVIGILQSLFLPGLLCLLFFNFTFLNLAVFFLAVPLSFLFNHFLITLATFTGIYTPLFVWSVLALELFLFIYYLKKRNKLSFPRVQMVDWTLFEQFLLLVWLALVVSTIVRWIGSFGTIFDTWDAVASWNRWANDWYNSIWPRFTWRYPQILPSIYSLNYKFIATNQVQFFAKASVCSFEFFGVLVFGHLAIVCKRYRLSGFISAIMLSYLLRKTTLVFSGYADTPLAVMIIMAFYILLRALELKDILQVKKMLWLGGVVVATAALVKQGGIYLAFLYPLMAFFLLKNRDDKIKNYLKIYLLIIIIVVPWYLYKEIQIHLGTDISAISTLIRMIGGTYFDRFIRALSVLNRNLSFFRVDTTLLIGPQLLLLFFFLVGCFSSILGRVLGIYTLLYSFIWIYGNSYDTRNLAPVGPTFAFVLALGIVKFISLWSKPVFPLKGFKISFKIGPKITALLLASFLIIITAASIKYPASYLQSRQNYLQKRIGNEKVNLKIYEYNETEGIKGIIITPYVFLGSIPKISKWYQWEECSSLSSFKNKKDIKYVLTYPHCPQNYRDAIWQDHLQGKLKFIFEVDGFQFFKKKSN